MTDPCQRVAAWCFISAAVLTVVGCITTPAPQPAKPIALSPQTTTASFAAKPPVSNASITEVVSVVVTPTPRPQPVVVAPAVSGTHEDWLRAAGIDLEDWQYVDFIVRSESGWQVTVTNPSSGSYGLCQALPRTKMATAGSDYLSNPVTQLRWCDSYAHSRYGGWPQAAAAWHQQHWW
jgi:hypothetical protein